MRLQIRQLKGATGMKKIFLMLLGLMLLSGCGISPQEKRNNYDACLIEEDRRLMAKFWAEFPNPYPQALQRYEKQVQDALPGLCVDNLK